MQYMPAAGVVEFIFKSKMRDWQQKTSSVSTYFLFWKFSSPVDDPLPSLQPYMAVLRY